MQQLDPSSTAATTSKSISDASAWGKVFEDIDCTCTACGMPWPHHSYRSKSLLSIVDTVPWIKFGLSSQIAVSLSRAHSLAFEPKKPRKTTHIAYGASPLWTPTWL